MNVELDCIINLFLRASSHLFNFFSEMVVSASAYNTGGTTMDETVCKLILYRKESGPLKYVVFYIGAAYNPSLRV